MRKVKKEGIHSNITNAFQLKLQRAGSFPPDIICAACSLSWGNWQKEKHKKKKSQPKLLQETRDPQSSGQTVPAFARLFRSERVQGPCTAPLSMAVLARESVPSGLQHTHAQTTAALYSPCSGVAAKHLPEHLLISASGIGHIFAQQASIQELQHSRALVSKRWGYKCFSSGKRTDHECQKGLMFLVTEINLTACE